jgi:AcrR family transcriptional regulator
MHGKGRTAVKTSERGDEVLDAAASTFMNLGFNATSVDAIGDALGVTKGFIYYYFKSKNEIFFAVQRRSMEFTRDAIEPIAKRDDRPAQKLRDMALAHTMLIMSRLPYLRVAAQGLELHLSGRTTPEDRAELESITKLRDRNEQLYVKVLKEGIRSGDFREMDASLSVKPLLGALNWTSRWYHPRPNETATDRDRLAQGIALFVLNGVLRS